MNILQISYLKLADHKNGKRPLEEYLNVYQT
jgi:hypothetical protein